MGIETHYTRASNLFDEGNYKDAYASFLSVLELSIQEFHKTKFAHQTITETPVQYENTITLSRSSLDHLEKITIQNKMLPGVTITPPPVPPKVPPPPPPAALYFRGPSRTLVSPSTKTKKPTVPPKPRIPPIITDTTPITRILNRPIKVSPTEKNTSNRTEQIGCEEDKDDDDEDDIVIEFDNVKPTASSRPFVFIMSSEYPVITTIADQTSIKPRSGSWIVRNDEIGEAIDVLSETVVNPSNLVPAQTNDSSLHSDYTTDYVPNIPAPPLLATHKKIQQRLSEMEKLLDETKKQQQQQQQPVVLSAPPQPNNNNQCYYYYQHDLLLSERSNNVSALRYTLDKVRTLYMSAMTIPSILQFPPHLIAYQLTLIESSIFRSIPCEALLSHSARTPHKRIVASTDFFNFITRSIEHSILLPQEASDRSKLISRWIKIATKLLALNNYQSLKAIVSALGTPPIQRLRKTWECIPKKHMARLELLSTLMSESNNYRRYREHLGLERRTKHQNKNQQQQQQHHVWTKPVVPFLGVFIHDVTYLQCAAKGNTNDTRFQDVLSQMEAFQRAPEYPQKPPPHYYANYYGKSNSGNSNNNNDNGYSVGVGGGSGGSKKHIPNAITNALHLGSSTKHQNTNRANASALMDKDDHEETELEIEQQLIIQYLLICPWVSEKTIDALSNLREPSTKPRSATSPITMTTNSNNYNGRLLSNNNSAYNNNNIISKSGSFMRFSAPQPQTNQFVLLEPEPLQVSPTTPTNNNNNEENKKLLGFWPFRKSNDLNRSSINSPPEQSWSEEEEDDDEDEDEDEGEEDDGEEAESEIRREGDRGDKIGEKKGMTTPLMDERKDDISKIIGSQHVEYESIQHHNSTISLEIN